MNIRIHCLALLLCAPLVAQAQINKCKQPDGSLIFQDEPCPSGASRSTVSVLPPTSRADGASAGGEGAQERRAGAPAQGQKSLQDQVDEYKKRRAEKEQSAREAEAEAYNRNARCNYARQQLGVVKEVAPVFHYDNKGNKQYIPDENRQAAIAAAQRRVASECN